MSDQPTPTVEQLAYASDLLARRRRIAIANAMRGDHHVAVTEMVFSFTDSEDDVAAGDVAYQILAYIADALEPLMEVPS